jgi:hypothetical protein
MCKGAATSKKTGKSQKRLRRIRAAFPHKWTISAGARRHNSSMTATSARVYLSRALKNVNSFLSDSLTKPS